MKERRKAVVNDSASGTLQILLQIEIGFDLLPNVATMPLTVVLDLY